MSTAGSISICALDLIGVAKLASNSCRLSSFIVEYNVGLRASRLAFSRRGRVAGVVRFAFVLVPELLWLDKENSVYKLKHPVRRQHVLVVKVFQYET